MLALVIPIIATALLTFSARVQAACYNVDGSESIDDSFTACDPGAEVSACCANNKGSRSDLCLSSGLCYAQDGNFRGLLYMNGCTDKSGSASECPHFCPDRPSPPCPAACVSDIVWADPWASQKQQTSTAGRR